MVFDSLHLQGRMEIDVETHAYKLLLTLPVPSLLVPTPDTRGGGGRPDPPLSQTVAAMNMKFCMILETSQNILEILQSVLHSD